MNQIAFETIVATFIHKILREVIVGESNLQYYQVERGTTWFISKDRNWSFHTWGNDSLGKAIAPTSLYC